ncbi:MAG TPA: DUF368 domain-containing protein [Oscillospiraceae bacterium]|nr:DUF368 domain-containing protein [Oscillospiraceae bacterium]HPV99777.1 DUF368 domain-containing protein [Oscillospiraceae bacterium]
MEPHAQKKQSPFSLWMIRLFQGILIGGGAILPGISGGVLCVTFGLYRPMMALLSHPERNFARYYKMFLPVAIGCGIGFFSFAKIIAVVFRASSLLAVCLFIGLIAGTFPKLYRDSGKQGRGAASWMGFAAGFVFSFASLLVSEITFRADLQPNVWWFLFCGVLWGLSIVVPGMTSSSMLISLGLYQPMAEGVASLDPGVLFPMGIGILGVTALTAKLINHLFETKYSVSYHAIMGIVLASTLYIIPREYGGPQEILLSVLCFGIGTAASLLMDNYFGGNEPQ